MADLWTGERIDALKQFWSDGLSASQIASHMGGLTRNAVIGKVHRLKLPGRVTLKRAPRPPRIPGGRILRIRMRINPALPQTPAPAENIAPLSLTLLEVSADQCKFICSGEGRDARYCGHPVSCRSYCAHHYNACYLPRRA